VRGVKRDNACGQGGPEDCVGAFLYLASEQMRGYVTGQIIEVNADNTCRDTC
jgi:NAD(P)-dependent dehydrogenase (short-subunit alcohol dehydrogenase family)